MALTAATMAILRGESLGLGALGSQISERNALDQPPEHPSPQLLWGWLCGLEPPAVGAEGGPCRTRRWPRSGRVGRTWSG